MSAEKPQLHTFRDWLRTYLGGCAMGAADLVPGISGGTVAFVLGFYAKLLNSLRSVNSKAVKSLFSFKLGTFFNTVAWEFILALVCGIATSMLLLSNPFYFLLHHPIYRTFFYSLFVGLTLGATILCCRQIKRWRTSYFAVFFFSTLIMFFVTLPRPAPQLPGPVYDVSVGSESLALIANRQPLVNYDLTTGRLTNVPALIVSAMLAKGLINDQTVVFSHATQETGTAGQFVKAAGTTRIDGWLVLCGMIGVCALLLPGISGSYILTILGAYPILITAIADLSRGLSSFSLDVDAFFVLLSVFIGIVIGAICFSHLLGYLLKRHHDITVAALIGCMLGALPSIWPFWTYEYIVPPLRWSHAPQLQTVAPYLPDWTSPYFLIALLWIGIGFFTVLGLEQLKKDKVAKSLHD